MQYKTNSPNDASYDNPKAGDTYATIEHLRSKSHAGVITMMFMANII